jgi:tetratricopeptide (TPR) repeat protein
MAVTDTTTTQPASPADKFQYAINLAKAGRKLEARDMLRQVVAVQPVNQAAWLWLSALATTSEEAEAALAQARVINAAHPSLRQAEQWAARRFSNLPVTQVTPLVSSPPVDPAFNENGASPSLLAPALARLTPSQKLWLSTNSFVFGAIISVVVAGLALLFVGLVLEVNTTVQAKPSGHSQVNVPNPQLEFAQSQYGPILADAQTNRDWSTAIAILEEYHRLDPNSPKIQAQLADAYFQKALILRHKGLIEEALTNFQQATNFDPHHSSARHEIALAKDYLEGIQHYQNGKWQNAIAALETVQAEKEGYINVNDLLFSAYYNHGLALRAADMLPQARAAFETAITLRPDLNEPYRQIAEIEFALAPQTPLATPITAILPNTVIVVSVAEQRMHVYENGKLIFDFVTSTGEPGRDTAIGEFEILDKIDVAYASTWNLDMPYWMGIYWSGPLENGIHALPIVKHTGYKLWDGFLGQRVSYGCVILSDEDAATLFEWAKIGTKVKIVPSFAYFSLEE